MELNKINKLLQNLKYPDSKELTRIERINTHTPISNEGEGIQGESNKFSIVYKIVSEEELFLKVDYETDSYGYEEAPYAVSFVKPKEKVKIEYVTI